MATTAISDYAFEWPDRVENFHGAQLLYIGWDQHLLFCAPYCFPFPPNMKFRDILMGVLPGCYGYHPDFAQIDWDTVTWLKSGQPWQPDYDKTLEELGLKHKDALRFKTPGLNGIKGCAS